MSEHLGFEKDQKTESQRAEQIQRISLKLGERAIGLTPTGREDIDPDNMFVAIEDGGNFVISTLHNTEGKTEGVSMFTKGEVNLKKTKVEGGIRKESTVHSSDENGVQGVFTTQNESGRSTITELSDEQNVTAAASTLSKLRGEVASREKHDAKNKIDEFLKS